MSISEDQNAQNISSFGYLFPLVPSVVNTYGYTPNDIVTNVDGVVIIGNHVEQALSLLIEQFKKDYVPKA